MIAESLHSAPTETTCAPFSLDQISALRERQSVSYIEPLRCLVDGSALVPGGSSLTCPCCGWVQQEVPAADADPGRFPSLEQVLEGLGILLA